jgi:hypothetical protein
MLSHEYRDLAVSIPTLPNLLSFPLLFELEGVG